MHKFTVYALLERKGKNLQYKHVNRPVYTFDETPVDWSHLRFIMLNSARHIYFDLDHQTVTQVKLWQHLSGKYVRGFTSYRTSRTRIGRVFQFGARLTYFAHENRVVIDLAAFGPLTLPFRESYWREKGREWKMRPVVPPSFEANLRNPKILSRNLLTLKTLSYATKPHSVYGGIKREYQEKASLRGFYGGRNYQDEQNREERERKP